MEEVGRAGTRPGHRAGDVELEERRGAVRFSQPFVPYYCTLCTSSYPLLSHTTFRERYNLFIPLHQLWLGYVSELLGLALPPVPGSPPSPQAMPKVEPMHAKLIKADYHGSIVTGLSYAYVLCHPDRPLNKGIASRSGACEEPLSRRYVGDCGA